MKELKLGPNIARNTALSENVFMMLVCIELRIPLFVVGKPGSSKSLAKTVVADNMQGERSSSELFKNFKQVSQKCGSCLARFASVHSFFQLGIIQPSIVQYINIIDPPRFFHGLQLIETNFHRLHRKERLKTRQRTKS